MKVLFFSPIRKELEILKITIPSWLGLNTKNINIKYLFFDDNDSSSSSNYLNTFSNKNIEIIKYKTTISDNYQGDHNWNIEQIDRISEIKNFALEKCYKEGFDAVFLVDADLVLHPNTLESLMSSKKDFVFEIFWTDFQKNGNYRPNCWDYHSWEYNNANSILKLKEKGYYKVGAGGACTLINRNLIERGLNFDRIPNMKFNGEDRHISSRVYSLNSEIFIDTNYPAYHIHDINKVEEAKEWFYNECKREFFDTWLNDNWKNQIIEFYKPVTSIIIKLKRAFYLSRRAFINALK